MATVFSDEVDEHLLAVADQAKRRTSWKKI
jgi:hypothetical protein